MAHRAFPRQNRRGLIEASGGSGTSRSWSCAFPRQNRRGLIEAPDRRASSRAGASPFPGRIAGASLKPDHPAAGRTRGEQPFPRQNRRGLIEAYRKM